jgi:hypothetical protein
MKRADHRSVGELLLECDLTARRMLIDPDVLDPAAMVRAWPEMVQAAHELLQALPTQDSPATCVYGPQARSGDLTGERLHLMAIALHLNLSQRVWPGEGPVDRHFLTIADNLVRAHDLIDQHLRRPSTPTPDVLADAAAARTRVLHALYVGSHAIQVAARAQYRDLQIRKGPHSARRRASQLNALQFVQDKTAAFEQVAGAEVHRLFPGALSGERREPTATDRLRTALASWDVETHRALAREPSMANLCELTHVQSTTLALTRMLLNAAVTADVVDQAPARAHVEPRLAAAQSAWGKLHGTLRRLTRNAYRTVSRDLSLAGSELVLALSDLVFDGTTVADPATIAGRVDLGRTVSTLAEAMDAPHQASLLLLDAALDPRNRVDANAAQHLISQLSDAAGEVTSPDDCWIDPRDLAANRDITPPAPIRGIISAQVQTVRATSRTLAAGASALVAAAAPTATPRDEPTRSGLDREIGGPIRPQPATHISR